MNRLFLGALIFFGALCISPSYAQLSLTIDYAQKHQTWEGYGGFGAQTQWWVDYQLDDSFIDYLLDTLKFRVFRTNCFDPTHFVQFDRTRPEVKKIQDRANQKGIEIKWITSIWSAPLDMKTNNARRAGRVKDDRMNDYAQYAVDWCVGEFENLGITPYALSLQNEPNLLAYYGSGDYNPEQYNDLIRKAGARFKQLRPDIRLFGPEGATPWATMQYLPPLVQDDVSAGAIDAIAAHGYWAKQDLPLVGSNAVYEWQEIASAARIHNHPVWQTEAGGWSKIWKFEHPVNSEEDIGGGGLLHFHSDHFIFHRYGNGTLWVHWLIGAKQANDPHAMFFGGQPNEYAHMYRHYSAFILPGAIRVESSIFEQEKLFTNAWYHPDDNTLTLTLLNLGNQNLQVSLESDSLPQKFERYLSADIDDNCKHTGSISSVSPIDIPPQSVTTLYGFFSDGSVGNAQPFADKKKSGMINVMTLDGRMNIYDIKGRTLTPGGQSATMITTTQSGRITSPIK